MDAELDAEARLVTPPVAMRPVGLIVLLVLLLCGGVLLLGGWRGAFPRTTTALVIGPAPDGRTEISVLGGPEPGRYHLSGLDEPASPGDRITVRLRGGCRCVPSLADDGDGPGRAIGALLPGAALTTVALWSIGGSTVRVRRSRRSERRALATVGTGPATSVRLVPVWTRSSYPLDLELRATEDDRVLGRVGLWWPDRAFDPTVPFTAWGDLVPGSPIALTAEAGGQVVIPVTPLTRPTDRPAPAPEVTAAVAAVLGWPTAGNPGDPSRLAAVDQAVEGYRRRCRVAVPAGVVGAVAGLGLALAAAPPPLTGLAFVVPCLVGRAMVRYVGTDVRALVRARVEGRGPLVAQWRDVS